MIMTLFVIIDDTGNKRKILHDYEHSNWHHLRTLQKLMKYFQSDMFGGKHSTKEELIIKKLKEIFKKNSNGNEEDFEEVKCFSVLIKELDEWSMDGFVIIHFYKDIFKDNRHEIHLNVSSTEGDRDIVAESFKSIVKEIGRFRKN